jgi:hypothetical protein
MKIDNVIQHITRSKEKNNMLISISAEKVFDKIQHPFRMKALKKLRMERRNFNRIKSI